MAEFYDKLSPAYSTAMELPAHEYRFKIELLDHNERGLGEIIRDIDSSSVGEININRQQGLRRSCSFILIDVDKKYLPSIDNHFWYNRKFKLYIGAVINDDIYWFSQGVFVTQTASAVHHSVSISAVDKFGFLDGTLNVHMLQDTYDVEIGVGIGECVRHILMLETGNGTPIDTIEPIIDPAFENIKLINEIVLDAGQYLGEALTQIATTLGADLFYDRYGRLNLTRVFNDDLPSWYIHKGEIWHFNDTKLNYIDPSLSYDFDGINCVTVTIDNGNDTTKELVSYTATNDNPRSPVAISAVGYRCNKDEPVIYIPAGDIDKKDSPLEKCRQHAEYVLLQHTCMSTPLSFKCPIMPHLDVDEAISITDNYYNWEEKTFLIQSISIPFGVGEMDISAINVQWLATDTDSASITLQKGSQAMPVFIVRYDIGIGAEGKTPNSYSDVAGTCIMLADNSGFEHPTKEFINWIDDRTGKEWGDFFWSHYAYTIPNQNVLMTANYKEYTGTGILEMKLSLADTNVTAYPVFDDNKQLIRWGDNSISKLNSGEVTHNYPVIGDYMINIQELEGVTGVFNWSNFGKYLNSYTIKEIYLPDNITSMDENMCDTLNTGNSNLEVLKLPANLQTITAPTNGFCSGMTNLKEVVFPTIDCTIIGTAFPTSFSHDTKVTVPSNISFTNTGVVFPSCTMKEIEFNGNLLQSITLCPGCINLTKAILNGTGSLNGGTFSGCSELETVVIGSNMSIDGGGFCTNSPKLKNLDIESGSTTVLRSGFLYFPDTTPNTAMTVLDLSSTSITAMESGVINYMTALEEIRFPNQLTVLAAGICNSGLPSLKRIYFGSEITEIHESCFMGNTDLTVYGYKGTYAEEWAVSRGFTFTAIE